MFINIKLLLITYIFYLIVYVSYGIENYGGLEKPFEQLKGSLSQEQLKRAHTIIENPNLTKQEIKDQIQQYFQKLGEPFYSKYKNASNTFENQIANMTAKAEALKANLSQPSKLIIDKILSIHKDLSITLAQEKEQVKALVQKAAPDVKQEIEKAKIQFQQKFGDSMGSTQEIL